ncbi:heme exporter protein CcmD [Pseudovibrio sp. Tun.PSC04-5.I4]|uniref:heme exporter protein CcmD n=1 Tax=Pseudovibrio sp. Tun.PSC04-5.I4 TaxID=1798213 RepID=UPI001AD9101F|nr:heme exporter protein CcmD [Pseudovibrio sp. Tun.PSC04-5.I4]
MDFGRHAGYVFAAYGMAAVVIAALIVWVRTDKTRLEGEMHALEASGIRRRSARRAAPAVSQVVSAENKDDSGK